MLFTTVALCILLCQWFSRTRTPLRPRQMLRAKKSGPETVGLQGLQERAKRARNGRDHKGERSEPETVGPIMRAKWARDSRSQRTRARQASELQPPVQITSKHPTPTATPPAKITFKGKIPNWDSDEKVKKITYSCFAPCPDGTGMEWNGMENTWIPKGTVE